jgi:hypothetical protein
VDDIWNAEEDIAVVVCIEKMRRDYRDYHYMVRLLEGDVCGRLL